MTHGLKFKKIVIITVLMWMKYSVNTVMEINPAQPSVRCNLQFTFNLCKKN